MFEGPSRLNDAVRANIERMREIASELEVLHISQPDSPRIKTLLREFELLQKENERDFEKMNQKLEEVNQKTEKFEQLSFDLQRQIATLSATIVLALLALSEVFKGTPGLRSTVGDASSFFIFAVGASVGAIMISSVQVLPLSEGDRLVQAFGKFCFWLGLLFSLLSIWLFFTGILVMGNFLRGS